LLAESEVCIGAGTKGGVKWELGFALFSTGKMRFTAMGLGFNHWEGKNNFTVKLEWDFSPFTIFDYII